uniref:Thiosulfate sulfurtransferase n=1 Tax=Chaetophora sp. FACHB-2423 TaxID=2725789 RepID=A0A6H1XE45_9CHLO|nr:Thiosulfate sulfurtransferase [Chaetophora sp. FACHB-2423]
MGERKSFAFPFFAFSFSPRKNLQFFLVSCVKDSQCRVLNTRKFSLSWKRKTRKKLSKKKLAVFSSFLCKGLVISSPLHKKSFFLGPNKRESNGKKSFKITAVILKSYGLKTGKQTVLLFRFRAHVCFPLLNGKE